MTSRRGHKALGWPGQGHGQRNHPHMARSSEQLQEDVTVLCRAVSPRAGGVSTIGVPGVLQGRSSLREQELPLPCPGGSGPQGAAEAAARELLGCLTAPSWAGVSPAWHHSLCRPWGGPSTPGNSEGSREICPTSFHTAQSPRGCAEHTGVGSKAAFFSQGRHSGAATVRAVYTARKTD